MPQIQTSDPQKSAQNTALFVECVTMYAHQAMIAMGKIVNPVTKKAERNLAAARWFIDIIEMLEAKTKANLNRDEEQLLANTLSSLRLTFVEEAERPEPTAESAESGTGSAAPKPETPAQSQPPSEPPAPEERKKRFTKRYD